MSKNLQNGPKGKCILAANIEHGQIVTKKVGGERLPDEMIRDGWVAVHEQTPPLIRVVVKGGRVVSVASDHPTLRLTVTDLDASEKPEQEEQREKEQASSLYCFTP